MLKGRGLRLPDPNERDTQFLRSRLSPTSSWLLGILARTSVATHSISKQRPRVGRGRI